MTRIDRAFILVGLVLITVGCWRIYDPAAFIVLGTGLIVLAMWTPS